MLKELLLSPLSPWQNGSGEHADIVIDSRVRLNRNLKKYVFPARASEGELAAVLAEVQRCQGTLDTLGKGQYDFLSLADATPAERDLLAVKHLSSPEHLKTVKDRGVLVREDGGAAILVNEEDHVVIQTSAPGLNLEKAWADANSIDDALEGRLDFAFRDDVGYLTSSPSLTGTGLSVGVTIHIPALVLRKRLSSIVQGVSKFGFNVSGLYGEGREWLGDVFQITNQITLGVSEKELLDQLNKIVAQIIREEENSRKLLWTHNASELRDKWLRTYGILQHAWLLEDQETLTMVGYLRFGIDMGIIPLQPLAYEALMTVIEPAYLQLKTGKELNGEDLEHARAEAVQDILARYAK